jgi:hypothetical protein
VSNVCSNFFRKSVSHELPFFRPNVVRAVRNNGEKSVIAIAIDAAGHWFCAVSLPSIRSQVLIIDTCHAKICKDIGRHVKRFYEMSFPVASTFLY